MGKYDIIIAGGGLAGVLSAVALKRVNPELSLMLIERAANFGGNHRWSWFDSDLSDAGSGLLADLPKLRWPRYDVRFPSRCRTMETGYNSTTSLDLDRWALSTLSEAERLTGVEVAAITDRTVALADGRVLSAQRVIDARGAGPEPVQGVGWQKFAGFELEVRGHGVMHPVLMDACVEQSDGFRFVYTLPLDDNRLFVEDTYYADGPELELGRLRANAMEHAAQFGRVSAELSYETGALPIPLSASPSRFWPAEGRVVRIGMRGGFFHHTTGYSLPNAVANALLQASDWKSGIRPDAVVWRSHFLDSWRNQRYFRLLNRLLFKATVQDQRYRVFEHFYRLPEPLIERFYAGRLTLADKVRILTGRPPVPMGRALSVLLGKV